MKRPAALAAVSLLLAFTLAACSTSTGGAPSVSPGVGAASGAAPAAATQLSEGGQVTVEATWKGLAAGATFDVKLDTHSVDLDGLDLSNAFLRNDRGDQLSARPWAAPKGGHHRDGPLSFDGDASRFLAGAKWIEMVLSDVGDIPERALRWEIGS